MQCAAAIDFIDNVASSSHHYCHDCKLTISIQTRLAFAVCCCNRLWGQFCCRFNDSETDAATQKAGGFSAPRYFGARQARAERDRSLKRLRLGHALEGAKGRAEQDKALKKLRLGHALEGTQGFKENGPAKLSLPLPVFIPLEQASKQVTSTTVTVVS